MCVSLRHAALHGKALISVSLALSVYNDGSENRLSAALSMLTLSIRVLAHMRHVNQPQPVSCATTPLLKTPTLRARY